MKPLKPIDHKILAAFLKDSKRYDRQIAKAFGVSQPTVTRRRRLLEKACLDGYTAVPRLSKIGFEIEAFTFMKAKHISESLGAKHEVLPIRKLTFQAPRQGRLSRTLAPL